MLNELILGKILPLNFHFGRLLDLKYKIIISFMEVLNTHTPPPNPQTHPPPLNDRKKSTYIYITISNFFMMGSQFKLLRQKFRPSPYTLPSGSSAIYTRGAERRVYGWGGMGWDGMGWMGWTGYQKCPSIFFILCGYIDHVYVYLYI